MSDPTGQSPASHEGVDESYDIGANSPYHESVLNIDEDRIVLTPKPGAKEIDLPVDPRDDEEITVTRRQLRIMVKTMVDLAKPKQPNPADTLREICLESGLDVDEEAFARLRHHYDEVIS